MRIGELRFASCLPDQMWSYMVISCDGMEWAGPEGGQGGAIAVTPGGHALLLRGLVFGVSRSKSSLKLLETGRSRVRSLQASPPIVCQDFSKHCLRFPFLRPSARHRSVGNLSCTFSAQLCFANTKFDFTKFTLSCSPKVLRLLARYFPF